MGATGPAFYTNRRRQPGQFPRQTGGSQPVQPTIQSANPVAAARQIDETPAGVELLEQFKSGMQGFGSRRATLLQRLAHLADQRTLGAVPLQLQTDESADRALPVGNQAGSEFLEQPGLHRAGPVGTLHETGIAGDQQQSRETTRIACGQLQRVETAHRPSEQPAIPELPGQALDLPIEILVMPGRSAMAGQVDGLRPNPALQFRLQRIEYPRIQPPAVQQIQTIHIRAAPSRRVCCARAQAVTVRAIIRRKPSFVENTAVITVALVVAAYLLGSFSSAITLSRLMGFEDPRSQGSRNPGATNVLRIAGKKAAALTLFGDLLKGLLPVLLARALLDSDLAIAAVGFAAFVGHCYPLWYRFDGGKGVATAIGFVLAYDWMLGLAVVAIWLIVARLFKLSSLAALIAFACLPALHAAVGGGALVTALFILLDLILIWRHRGNIRRLLRGEEPVGKL